MSAEITREILEAHINCKFKAHLKLAGDHGTPSDYGELLVRQRSEVRQKAIDKILAQHAPDEVVQNEALTTAALKRGPLFILEPHLENDLVSFRFDGLKKVDGSSKLGDFHYVPMLFHETRQVRKEQRLLLEVCALLLSHIQGRMPAGGIVWHGKADSTTRLRLSTDLRKAERVLGDLEKLGKSEPPKLLLNDHCQICEFHQRCREQAVREDNLSLLRGISEKEIKKWARQGIFTVTQLSCTYRARKPRKGAEKKDPRHSFALKALAVRDNLIYVVKKAVVPAAGVRLYLDVEGIPDSGFYYLIGLSVIEDGRSLQNLSYWADTQSDEESIWRAFLSAIRGYDDFTLFHYGSYEAAFINHLGKRYYRKADAALLRRLRASSVNTLSLIYAKYYFPTYTNGLKDIAKFLGYRWSAENAAGLTSIVWRNMWELTGRQEFKDNLVQYNREDCLALKVVTEAVITAPDPSVKEGKGAAEFESTLESSYRSPPKSEVQHILRWGEFKSPIAHFEEINKYAYFEYQRTRVYLKTNKKIGQHLKRQSMQVANVNRVTKIVRISHPNRCQHCGLSGVTKHSRFSHTNIDLKFTSTGVRRCVTRYLGNRYFCSHCNRVIKPKSGKGIVKYGDGLSIWAMDLFVAHGVNLDTIKRMLLDLFRIQLSHGIVHSMKTTMANKYKAAVAKLTREIISGSLLHIDETTVKVAGFSSPYVWILTNMDTVIYLFRPNREVDFLKTLLRGFKGILVSDFYPGYDAIPCVQQKCLIHLMRDLNDDFLQNQFDPEYKKLVVGFSVLLNEIMVTVNRHGLLKKYLRKHLKSVNEFFKNTVDTDDVRQGGSELFEGWQKRFQKNRDVLFTFLSHDNCPWNNNNAEHAVTPFARHRAVRGVEFTERSISEYLVLLSVQQTCRYRGFSFLGFLQSGLTDLEKYSSK